MEEKRHVRTQTGVVISDRMDKTVVVRVERRVKHPVYMKYLERHKRFKAHDPRNECKVGDIVLLKESRPLSRDKHWQVESIVTPAKGRG